jgi:hypothetical protein
LALSHTPLEYVKRRDTQEEGTLKLQFRLYHNFINSLSYIHSGEIIFEKASSNMSPMGIQVLLGINSWLHGNCSGSWASRVCSHKPIELFSISCTKYGIWNRGKHSDTVKAATRNISIRLWNKNLLF